MNERLGIETAIKLFESANREQIASLKTAYNNYGIGKRYENELLNDAKKELDDINQVFLNAGLDAPFILSYAQLNTSLDRKKESIAELEKQRAEARAAYMELDEEKLMAQNPYITLNEIKTRKATASKKWDELNSAIDAAWRKYRLLEEQKKRITDPGLFDASCNTVEYLRSITDSNADEVLKTYVPYTQIGLDGKPLVSSERLNILLQSKLYAVDLSLESALEKRKLIEQNIAVFESVGKEIGVELIYDEKVAAFNAAQVAQQMTSDYTSSQIFTMGTGLGTGTGFGTNGLGAGGTSIGNNFGGTGTSGTGAGNNSGGAGTSGTGASNNSGGAGTSGTDANSDDFDKACEDANALIADVESMIPEWNIRGVDLLAGEKEYLNDVVEQLKVAMNNKNLEEIKLISYSLSKDFGELLELLNTNAFGVLAEADNMLSNWDDLFADGRDDDKRLINTTLDGIAAAMNYGGFREVEREIENLDNYLNQLLDETFINEAKEKIAKAEGLISDWSSFFDDVWASDKAVLDNDITELGIAIHDRDLEGIKRLSGELDSHLDTIGKEVGKKVFNQIDSAYADDLSDLSPMERSTIRPAAEELEKALSAVHVNADEINEKAKKLYDIAEPILSAVEAIDRADALISESNKVVSRKEKKSLKEMKKELMSARLEGDADRIKVARDDLNKKIADVETNVQKKKNDTLDEKFPLGTRYEVIKQKAAKVAKSTGSILKASAIAGVAMTGLIGVTTGVWLSPGILSPLAAVLTTSGFSGALQILYQHVIVPKFGLDAEMEELRIKKGKKKKALYPFWLTNGVSAIKRKAFGAVKDWVANKSAEHAEKKEAKLQEKRRLAEEAARALKEAAEKAEAKKAQGKYFAEPLAPSEPEPVPGESAPVPAPIVDDDDPFAEDEEETLAAPASDTTLEGEGTGEPLYDEDFFKNLGSEDLFGKIQFSDLAQKLGTSPQDLVSKLNGIADEDLDLGDASGLVDGDLGPGLEEGRGR